MFVGDYATGLPSNCSDFKNFDGDSDEESDQDEEANPLHKINHVAWYFTLREFLGLLSSYDFELFSRLLDTLRRHPGTKHSGVLRNLDKQIYVRDSALASSKLVCSLGDIIILQTQWTDEPHPSGCCGTDDWTGDRFDIRSESESLDGWTDVSDEVLVIAQRRMSYRYVTREGFRSWVD